MSGKRYWASTIKRLLTAVCVVFLIGVMFDYFVSLPDRRSPFATGAIACGLFFVASFIVSLIDALSKGVYLWLFSGNDMVEGILDEMRAHHLPPPRYDQHKDFDYLIEIANDDKADTLDRVRAASFSGAYNALMMQGIFRALSLRRALDAAVLRYAELAPLRQ
jgi:hypothetical protein